MKRLKELTDELNTEKRRINDLLKEKNEKERDIQILHAQLDAVQHKQQAAPSNSKPQPQNQEVQQLQVQLQRLTEENQRLTKQVAQQSASSNATSNGGDSNNAQVRVLSEQMKKLSVDNATLDKKAKSLESRVEEAQKQNEDLTR